MRNNFYITGCRQNPKKMISGILSPQRQCYGATSRHNSRHGFTLMELLVVIAIIALLLSILLPSLMRAKELARRIVCKSNIKSLAIACEMYATSNNDYYPFNTEGDPYHGYGWRASPRLLMAENFAEYKSYNCPSMPPLVPPMGDFPINEYYGDGFDEAAQIEGRNPGKSVVNSYGFRVFREEYGESGYLERTPLRRTECRTDGGIINDVASAIIYYDTGFHDRFFPMVSHFGDGGNVAHVDTSVIWMPASQWQWPGTSPYLKWPY